MAPKIDESLVTKAAKKLKTLGFGRVSEMKNSELFDIIAKECKVGLPPADMIVYRAEPVAFPQLKLKSTGKEIRNARDKQGLRWERIAARTGISVAEVKSRYADAGGDLATSYTGKGRMPSGVSPSPKKAAETGAKKTGVKVTKPAAKKTVKIKNRKRSALAGSRP